MPADPRGAFFVPLDGTSAEEAVARLCNTLDRSVGYAEALARAFYDEGDFYHAGLLAGSAISIATAERQARLVSQVVGKPITKEAKGDIRQDKKRDAQIEGQMQFV